MDAPRTALLSIATDGGDAHVRVSEATGGGLLIEVDAPYFGDPAPPALPGPTDRLYEFEVVEIFFAARSEPSRYLEVELSPHGHHFVLAFEGVRNAVAKAIQIPYAARLDPARRRWSGAAFVPAAWLPQDELLANAFAVHRLGSERAFRQAYPFPDEPPGAAPNFHRPHAYPRLFPEEIR
jgi:hypothetical protein